MGWEQNFGVPTELDQRKTQQDAKRDQNGIKMGPKWPQMESRPHADPPPQTL